MTDSCLRRGPVQQKEASDTSAEVIKTGSGISVYLLEELGDARLRCSQLKKYIDEAVNLINKSEHRDRFFEVAANLIYAIPDTLLRMDKALSASALAASKLDYEEIKDDLRPEKVEELEAALEEVRVRRVQRRSQTKEANSTAVVDHKAEEAFRQVILPYLRHETEDVLEKTVANAMIALARMRAGNPTSFASKLERYKPVSDLPDSDWADLVEEAMEEWFSSTKKKLNLRQGKAIRIPEAVAQLERLAALAEATGSVDTEGLANLVSRLEGQTKTATEGNEIASTLRGLAGSFLDTTNPEPPSRLVLASALRRILADVIDVTAAGGERTAAFGPIKIKNREHGSGVSVKDFQDALNQTAENLFMCRGANRTMGQALEDAMTGYVGRIGPLTGMPDSALRRAQESKKSLYELDGTMGNVAKLLESLSRELKTTIPTEERRDKVLTASEDHEAETEVEARFEEGVPADPTENMNPEDAKKWWEEHDKNKDKFKAASFGTPREPTAEEAKRSRFEEGKPADPTKNMSPEDAKKWKRQTEEHSDEFKAATDWAK